MSRTESTRSHPPAESAESSTKASLDLDAATVGAGIGVLVVMLIGLLLDLLRGAGHGIRRSTARH